MKIFQFDIVKRVFLFVWSVFIMTAVAIAAPLGGDPTQGYCQTVDGSACGWGGTQPNKIINIPSRYGAVAYDGDKLILTASDNNLKSLRAAKKEAVDKCISYGGSKSSCKVLVSTRNGCNAVALGGKGQGGVAVGVSKKTSQLAENTAMQECRQMGGEKCFLAYSKCSRDPRYQVDRAIME